MLIVTGSMWHARTPMLPNLVSLAGRGPPDDDITAHARVEHVPQCHRPLPPPAMGLVSPLAEAPLWDGGTVKMAVPSPGTANYTLPPAMGLVRPTLGATRALCGGTQTQRHTRRIAGAGTSHPTGVGRPYRGPATPPIPPYPTIPPAPTPHV